MQFISWLKPVQRVLQESDARMSGTPAADGMMMSHGDAEDDDDDGDRLTPRADILEPYVMEAQSREPSYLTARFVSVFRIVDKYSWVVAVP